jgi:hypothetical protein
MACTCTEDKEILANGTIIGRNKVECSECQVSRLVFEAKKAKDDELAEKKAYLLSTDYIVLRQSEQNNLLQQDYDAIKVLRQAARDRINELEII